jgi:hypothetical protein
MRNALEKAGYTFVSSGLFKWVYTKPYSRYVVKVTRGHTSGAWHFGGGTAQDFYNTLPKEKTPYFLPVLYEDDIIQIQRRVKVCGQRGCWTDTFDGHSQNHAHIDGKAITFDYGEKP